MKECTNTVNFTKEHEDKMSAMILEAFREGWTTNRRLGGEMNIYDVFHKLTLNQQKDLFFQFKNELDKAESENDGWMASPSAQKRIEQLKFNKELLYYIVGYHTFKYAEEEKAKRVAELDKLIKQTEESTKTPADKLADLRKQRAMLLGEVFVEDAKPTDGVPADKED